MRTLSSRTMAVIAYERGEDYDPALMLSDGLLEQLTLSEHAAPLLEAPSDYERRRRRQRERRAARAGVPDWFSVEDLLDGPLPLAHHEPVLRAAAGRPAAVATPRPGSPTPYDH